MATFLPILGELSGKLAGIVFSRNRRGAYVRQYVVPTNPNSAAQQAARASFGQATQAYHQLSDSQKTWWQSFATEKFNPANNTNVGQYSGQNAFVSLWTASIQANKNVGSTTYEALGVPLVTDSDVVRFGKSVPPIEPIQATIGQTGELEALPIVVDAVEVSKFGETYLSVLWDGVPIGGLVGTDLVDGAGNAFDFVLYMSNVKAQKHSYTDNPGMQCIHSSRIPTFGITNLTASMGVNVYGGKSPSWDKLKSKPNAGEIVEVGVYMMSDQGMKACIGSAQVVVGESVPIAAEP